MAVPSTFCIKYPFAVANGVGFSVQALKGGEGNVRFERNMQSCLLLVEVDSEKLSRDM